MEVKDIKGALQRLVEYNGSDYILTGVIIRRRARTDKNGRIGEYFYQAELKSLKCEKSLTIARLDLVNKKR